jgi:hypothetical protein
MISTRMKLSTLLLALLAAAPSIAAAEEPPLRTESPGPGFLIGGLALLGGGVAIDGLTAYKGSARCFDRNEACFHLGNLGGTVRLGGAALTTAYFWKLGEHQFALDYQASSAPLDPRPYRTLAWATFSAGALGFLGGVVYIAIRAVDRCPDTLVTDPDAGGCNRALYRDAFWVTVAASPVLAAGAGLIGYTYGYEGAAKGRVRRGTAMILPTLEREGGGLAVVGSF